MSYDTLWWMVPEIRIKLNDSSVEIAMREILEQAAFCEVALVSGPVRGEKRGETGWLPVSAFILSSCLQTCSTYHTSTVRWT
jgi:hypothetical protein